MRVSSISRFQPKFRHDTSVKSSTCLSESRQALGEDEGKVKAIMNMRMMMGQLIDDNQICNSVHILVGSYSHQMMLIPKSSSIGW